MHKMRWDDLQTLLAVADHGSASAAAAALGLNHTTVLRRVNAFETRHGLKLFERHASGYRPTEDGQSILAIAREIDGAVDGIHRHLVGKDRKLSGAVKLTTTDSIFTSIISGLLREFQAKHPKISIELHMTNVRLDLAKMDADVSVRPSRSPPEPLIGRKACGLAFAIYGREEDAAIVSAQELERIGNWLGPNHELKNSPVDDWISESIPRHKHVSRANSFVALRDMAAAGMGATVLPCVLGDQSVGLVRLSDPIPELDTTLWVLTHPDLKASARVAALADFLSKRLRDNRRLLEGTSPQAT